MAPTNLEDMLMQAQKLELSRFKTYSRDRQKVLNPEGKAVLAFLAKAEKRHLGIIRARLASLRKTGAIKGGRLPKKIALPVFQSSSNSSFSSTFHSVTGDINILKSANLQEKQDAPFYLHLAKKTTNKTAKTLFLGLMKEEKAHLALIQKKLKEMRLLSVAISRQNTSKLLFKNIFRH